MEKETELIPFRVELFCNECGGKMEYTGKCLTSYPAKYPHKCKQGHIKNVLGCPYPKTRYKPKGEV